MTACVHLGMCCQLTGSLVKVGMLWFHEWSQMCSHGLHPSILHLQADDSYTCTLVGITIAVGTTCMIGHCHVLLLC